MDLLLEGENRGFACSLWGCLARPGINARPVPGPEPIQCYLQCLPKLWGELSGGFGSLAVGGGVGQGLVGLKRGPYMGLPCPSHCSWSFSPSRGYWGCGSIFAVGLSEKGGKAQLGDYLSLPNTVQGPAGTPKPCPCTLPRPQLCICKGAV